MDCSVCGQIFYHDPFGCDSCDRWKVCFVCFEKEFVKGHCDQCFAIKQVQDVRLIECNSNGCRKTCIVNQTCSSCPDETIACAEHLRRCPNCSDIVCKCCFSIRYGGCKKCSEVCSKCRKHRNIIGFKKCFKCDDLHCSSCASIRLVAIKDSDMMTCWNHQQTCLDCKMKGIRSKTVESQFTVCQFYDCKQQGCPSQNYWHKKDKRTIRACHLHVRKCHGCRKFFPTSIMCFVHFKTNQSRTVSCPNCYFKLQNEIRHVIFANKAKKIGLPRDVTEIIAKKLFYS